MVKTTTNSIEVTNNGVIVSKMKTRSGFKKVYVIEQANSINHAFNGEKKPLLLDLTKIEKSSIEDVVSLISSETIEIASAIGILITSGFKKPVINAYLSLKGLKQLCPVQVFTDYREAELWLEEFVG